ncbi:hypothetical protein NMG60_11030125 [Bertholletia excelsa]
MAKLGLLPLTHFQKLAPAQAQNQEDSPPNQISITATAEATTPASWMWNPNPNPNLPTLDDDDSWEVKAFEEDTNHAMGTTWPPRSYTCTFCRREFRSAQALGGHMNVHRRDRARLQQALPGAVASSSSATASSALLIPSHDFVANSGQFVANGGLCLLYSLPNPNGTFASNPSMDSVSSFLSISPYPTTNSPPAINFPVASPSSNSSICHSNNTIASPSNKATHAIEELDLELRLGRTSPR